MSRQIQHKYDAFTKFLILIFVLGLTGCTTGIGKDKFGSFSGNSETLIAPDSNFTTNIDILLPPSTLDLLACLKCHKGLKINTKRRTLTGTHIDFVFDHPGFNSENRWCYSCHYTKALDSLRLETGKILSYQKAYELCFECHIKNYTFWAVGIHGRRTGKWNGEKQYLSCVYCHNPHSPKYKLVEPMKPPLKPI